MNSWLKLALYAIIGVIVGTLLLSVVAPGTPGLFNTGYGHYQMNMNTTMPYYGMNGYNNFQMPHMNGQMGMGGMMKMDNSGGMGMMRDMDKMDNMMMNMPMM